MRELAVFPHSFSFAGEDTVEKPYTLGAPWAGQPTMPGHELPGEEAEGEANRPAS